MSKMGYSYSLPSTQRGAVLIVSMIFMLTITVASVSSMRSATLQERMAGNAKDVNIAFQAAEAGLRDAEGALAKIAVGPFDGSNGLFESCSDPSDTRTECQGPSWQNPASMGWAAASKSIADVAKQPEYIIEEMTGVVDMNAPLDADKPIVTKAFYRVTARGFGASDRSMVVLSTSYKRSSL